MSLLTVDREKCIGCGICAEVCPKNYIEITKEGIPADAGLACITCGHCVAICPQAALDHAHAPLKGQVLLDKTPVLNAETAESFLRARRSIRVYKEEAVPKSKILKMLDIARLAPTGNNTQGVQYLVIDNKDTLQTITQATVAWMDEAITQGEPLAAYFTDLVEYYHKTGRDVILRNAPCFILALTEKSFTRGRDNTHFSLAYAELFAPSLALGTCWAGLVEACARSGYQPLLKVLDIPEELMVTGGIMVGYPKYSYKRLVDRSPLTVTWR
ncbi:nitroreductase family protein [Pelosinus fermentans]|uniref:Nitroreductase n=1 Tax=Pelosinus fermentans JBW45 TaxID=1192197 RepID=I9DFK6_9FIRM|nr:nitroreductase family protein [Pelosinus fermentans]AJQ28395.1 nitroreductase [Pelosinus fermentans JBW45]